MFHPHRALALLALVAGICPPMLTASEAVGSTRMVNLSSRAHLGGAVDHAISGFVITADDQEVLVRAIGPSLKGFGVKDFLADPQITIFDRAGAERASNDNWSASDAEAFARFGAFALEPGSADAALVVRLPAGAYTAVVRAADGGAGIALAEVYSSSAEAPLANVSTRAFAGSGESVLIPGLVIADGRGGRGPRRLLLRALGRSLEKFGVGGVLADPTLRVLDHRGVLIARNEAWMRDDHELVSFAMNAAGAFPFSEVGSNDAALVVDLPAGSYTLHVEDAAAASGVTLVEAYDLTPEEKNVAVAMRVMDARAVESTGRAARFAIERRGSVADLLIVHYELSGDAAAGVDFVAPSGRVVLPPGVVSSTIAIHPFSDSTREAAKQLTLTLQPGLGYTVAADDRAAAMVTDRPEAVFVADLRPAGSHVLSLGAGRALLTLDESGSAAIALDLSNLTASAAGARLELVRTGQPSVTLSHFPSETSSSAAWSVSPEAQLGPEELVEALMAGSLRITVGSDAHPDGELVGYLRPAGRPASPGSDAPPAVATPAGPQDDLEAARFLTQATFGPTTAAIAELQGKTYAQWIDEQMALPMSSHREATMADFAAHPEDKQPSGRPGRANRQAAWWKIALEGEDQLRQRMAFALSQLFVVSESSDLVYQYQEETAAFYDLLGRHAFGDFRLLLNEVSLSPIMGVFLGNLRNVAETAPDGPRPDENFARELMQLFTIGLVQLNDDGSEMVSPDGGVIATYDQVTIMETARALTGWGYHHSTPESIHLHAAPPDFLRPMVQYSSFHDDGAKTIINGVRLPAGAGGHADLKQLLDALFQHPNVPPFFCRQLIQRLVTSNPSPGYVRRVSRVFIDNGAGVRGDLAAVVRAVLLDPEARSSATASLPGYGKLKEPVLRLSNLLRALNVTHSGGRYRLLTQNALAQAPLQAPSVFNFFRPDHQPVGLLKDHGLVGPDFEIMTETTAIGTVNYLRSFIFGTPSDVRLQWDDLLPLAGTPEILVARLNLLLAAGGMRPAASSRIVDALRELASTTSELERVQTSALLAACSPDAAVQR